MKELRKLTDGYIIQLIKNGTSLNSEDIKKYPELIEQKRLTLLIKREIAKRKK